MAHKAIGDPPRNGSKRLPAALGSYEFFLNDTAVARRCIALIVIFLTFVRCGRPHCLPFAMLVVLNDMSYLSGNVVRKRARIFDRRSHGSVTPMLESRHV